MATRKSNLLKNDIPSNGMNVNGTRPLTVVYYSKDSNLKSVRPSLAVDRERARLSGKGVDPNIKNRSYFVVKTDDKMPPMLVGDGAHAYAAIVNGIFDRGSATTAQWDEIHETIRHDDSDADDESKFESALMQNSYNGYIDGNGKVIVVLGMSVKVKSVGKNADKLTKNVPIVAIERRPPVKSLPQAVTKKKLSSKESTILSQNMGELQKAAPSANIDKGTLSVNDDEYDAFTKAAKSLPNASATTSKMFPDMEAEETDNVSERKTRFSKKRDRQNSNKRLAETIQKVLLDDKFLKALSGKLSSTVREFSKETHDKKTGDAVGGEAVPEIEKTNAALEEIRKILIGLADISVSEDDAKIDLARDKMQDYLEKTKGNTDDEQRVVNNNFNTILRTMGKRKTPIEIKTPRSDLRKLREETTATKQDKAKSAFRKNASTTDALLGSLINAKKKGSADKMGFNKNLLRKGDELFGKGGTANFLRRRWGGTKQAERMPQGVVSSSVAPSIDAGGAGDGGIDVGDIAGGASLLGKAGKFVAKAGKFAAGGAVMYGGSQLLDMGLSAAGVGGNAIDEQADDDNWNRASMWEKIQSSIPRGIEKVGSFIGQDSLVNEARASRIANETEYLNKVSPKLAQSQLKPETEELASSFQDSATTQSVASPNVVSNVTNNSSPVQQILPNNMMSQRNTESAYQSSLTRKFVI